MSSLPDKEIKQPTNIDVEEREKKANSQYTSSFYTTNLFANFLFTSLPGIIELLQRTHMHTEKTDFDWIEYKNIHLARIFQKEDIPNILNTYKQLKLNMRKAKSATRQINEPRLSNIEETMEDNVELVRKKTEDGLLQRIDSNPYAASINLVTNTFSGRKSAQSTQSTQSITPISGTPLKNNTLKSNNISLDPSKVKTRSRAVTPTKNNTFSGNTTNITPYNSKSTTPVSTKANFMAATTSSTKKMR